MLASLAVVLFIFDSFMTSLDGQLQRASQNGDAEVVKYLVETGIDPAAERNIAIMLALYYGHLEVTKYLAEKNADPLPRIAT